MSDSAELLALRLGLIAILLVFVVLAALLMRNGLRAPQRAGRSRAGEGRARLLVVRAGQSGLPLGAEFVLAGTTTIGRDDDAGIQIGDASVSGAHALLERGANGWVIRDLGSTNGTLVGGRKIGARGVVLRDGVELAVGVVVMRFRG